ETGIRRHLDKRAAGVPGAREWEDDDGSVGQELRRLCQGALNATFLGPRLVLWGPYPLSRTALLQDANFLDPLSVKLDGWAMVTRAVVRGKGFTATCGGTDPYYGLLEGEVNDDSMTDRRDGQELACLEVATRKQPPLVLSIPDGARLAPDAPVTLDELVPGVEIPVWSKATCLEVNVDLVLTRLKVTDEPTGERVQVALAPGTVLGDEQPDFTPGEVWHGVECVAFAAQPPRVVELGYRGAGPVEAPPLSRHRGLVDSAGHQWGSGRPPHPHRRDAGHCGPPE